MNLKRITMALLALGALLTACKEEEELGLPKISLDRYEDALAAGEGSTTVQLTATRDWYIANAEKLSDWIAVNPSEGKASTQPQTVTITVNSNAGHDRVGDVVFSIGLAKAVFAVNQKGEKGELRKGTGTLEDPYTVLGAIEYVKDLGNNVQSPIAVYVKGKIATITEEFSTSYGNATFTISDDGTPTEVFTCYRVKYLNNKGWKASDTQIALGDDVVIYGNVVFYNGKTPETQQGTAYVYAHNDKTSSNGNQTEITSSTIADFIAKADGLYYRLTGKVSDFKTGTNSSGKNYMQFNLSDDTGKIVVYGFKDGQYEAWATKIKNGGTAVITGTYELYTNPKTGATQHEVMNTTIESFTDEGGPGPDPGVPSGSGTKEDPYNVAAACNAVKNLKWTSTTDYEKVGPYYVKGKVSAITQDYTYNVSDGRTFGNARFTISDTGSASGVEQFTLYNLNYLGGNKFQAGQTDIKVNDDVVIYAELMNYRNDTPENTGGYLYSLNGDTGQGQTGDTTTGTVAETIAVSDGTNVIINEAQVAAMSKQGLVVSDNTGNVYIYFDSKAGETVPSVSIGDKVKVEAVKASYGGVPEFKTAKVTKLSSGQMTYPSPKDITSSAASYAASVTEYIQLTGTLKLSGNYVNIEIDGVDASSRMGSVSAPLESLGVSSYDGKKVTVKGYFSGITGSNTKYINIIATEITPADPNAKYCNVNPTSISVKADETSASFSITSNAAWEASSDNSDFTVSPSSGSGDATVTVSFAANTGDAARTAHINVVCADASVNAVVTITQSKPSGGEPLVLAADFTTEDANLPQGSSAGKTDGTYSIDGYTLTLHAADKYYQTKSNDNYYLLIGKKDSYIEFPAVEGKSLVKVEFLTGAGASENVICDLAKGSDRLNVNSDKLKKGTEYTWTLTGEEGVAYRFVITNGYNAQFQTLTLTYE